MRHPGANLVSAKLTRDKLLDLAISTLTRIRHYPDRTDYANPSASSGQALFAIALLLGGLSLEEEPR